MKLYGLVKVFEDICYQLFLEVNNCYGKFKPAGTQGQTNEIKFSKGC